MKTLEEEHERKIENIRFAGQMAYLIIFIGIPILCIWLLERIFSQ